MMQYTCLKKVKTLYKKRKRRGKNAGLQKEAIPIKNANPQG